MSYSLSPELLTAQLQGPLPPVLIDVRRGAAFAGDPTIIPGAVWRDPEMVGQWARELPQNRPVVVYCVHGHAVSRDVCDVLRQRGIDAAVIAGGLEGWRAAHGQGAARTGDVP